jgi:GPH family glycoside/pentoside/hexuronide:cation symporter
LIAAASPALAAGFIEMTGKPVTEQLKFFWISVLYAPLIVAGTWVCVWRIRENKTKPAPSGGGFFRGLSTVVRNRPFLILLAAYTISAFGSNLPATLILYYVEYVLKADGAELFLMVYFLTGILFLPIWIRISRKIGKKHAWLLSMVINTGAFFGVFFLGAGDVRAYGLLVFLSGIGFGAGLAIPSSIQADVIDFDEMQSGKRREGRYIGLWSISKKLAAAFGVGVGLYLLGSYGYEPNVTQSEDVVFMLRVLYALVPCICNVIAFGIAFFYPITEERHMEIRKTIDSRV